MATILIADDHPATRLLLARLLSAHTLHLAADGAEALGLLCANPGTALLITDLDMPRLDGPQLLRALRRPEYAPARPRDTVVVSAHPLAAQRARLAGLGVSALFEKPLDVRAFKGRLEALLEAHPAPPR